VSVGKSPSVVSALPAAQLSTRMTRSHYPMTLPERASSTISFPQGIFAKLGWFCGRRIYR